MSENNANYSPVGFGDYHKNLSLSSYLPNQNKRCIWVLASLGMFLPTPSFGVAKK